MSEIERRFRVDEFVDDLVWVELLEGQKSGLQFAVPISHNEYSNELEMKIGNLVPGERITATLVSENEYNTAWRFKSIKTQNSQQFISADD